MYKEKIDFKTKPLEFTGAQEKPLKAQVWEPEAQIPERWLMILPGLGDFAARYEDFAIHMVGRGFGVLALDLRGHGETDPPASPVRGLLAPENGWEVLRQDLASVIRSFLDERDIKNISVLGKQIGGLLALDLLKHHGSDALIQGLIVTGPRGPLGFSENLALGRARSITRKQGPLHREDSFNAPYFNRLSKNFTPVKTDFDWLCRDERVVEDFLQNPLSQTEFPVGFWMEYLGGLRGLYKNSESRVLDTPVLLLAGGMDTYCGGEAGLERVKQGLEKVGFAQMSSKSYPDSRHELIMELNRREVFRDIHRWLEALSQDN